MPAGRAGLEVSQLPQATGERGRRAACERIGGLHRRPENDLRTIFSRPPVPPCLCAHRPPGGYGVTRGRGTGETGGLWARGAFPGGSSRGPHSGGLRRRSALFRARFTGASSRLSSSPAPASIRPAFAALFPPCAPIGRLGGTGLRAVKGFEQDCVLSNPIAP